MLIADGNVVATVAVNDIGAGKKFYGDKLGLKQVDENPGGVTYKVGDGRLFVYPSPTAGSGKATSAFFELKDFDAAMKELKDAGVTFEQYDEMPGMKDGVMDMDGMKAAWFKDPDGNILGIGSA